MSLTLYFHPLSSFCHKTLIALYENDTPFTPHLVDLGNAEARTAFLKVWPMGKFPVLHDTAGNRTIAESTIIIEYLDQYFPGKTKLLPAETELARQTRMHDRFYDLHVQIHMQKIVGDRIRPTGMKDPFGAGQAQAQLRTALDVIEKDIVGKIWSMGDAFTMADCAAAPALFYANKVIPFAASHTNTFAYLNRLMQRPSYARALKEAEPYFAMFPQ